MKRINVKLVIILTATMALCCLGAIGLYRFQMGRSTQTLLSQAELAKEKGDLKKARSNLKRYLQYQPEDHAQLVKLAFWTKEWFEKLLTDGKPVGAKEFNETYSLIEAGLRQAPDDTELRETAIQFAMSTGFRQTDAISHLTHFIQSGSAKAEHFSKLAQCYSQIGEDDLAVETLSKMIGFDSATGDFDGSTVAEYPAEVNAYLMLAQLLHNRMRQPETADRVIEQMVASNPGEALAYVGRASYLRLHSKDNHIEQATQDIEKALQLGGDEESQITVLREAAEVFQAAKDFPRAKEQLDRYHEIEPDSAEVYRMLSNWALQQNDLEQARDFINQGLEKHPENQRLLWTWAHLELDHNSLDQAERAIEALRQVNFSKPKLAFLEARLASVTGDHLQTSQKLEAIRPRLAQLEPTWIPAADRMLGAAYAELGQHDRALRYYLNVVEADPDNTYARWGVILALRSLGQIDDAIEHYTKLNRQLTADGGLPQKYPFLIVHLELEMSRQNQRPEEQRDWTFAKQLVSQIRLSNLTDLQKYTILANFYEKIGDEQRAARARSFIVDKDPDNVALHVKKIRTLAETDVDAALNELDAFEEKQSGLVVTRLIRIELLSKQRPDGLRQQLVRIEAEAARFNAREQALIFRNLGTAYMTLQEYDEVQRVFQIASQKTPQDVDLLLSIFRLAILRGNEEDIRSSLADIKNTLGADSAEWSWAEASRLIWRFKNKLEKAEVLDAARSLVQDARGKREGWAPLYYLDSEISDLKGDLESALTAMDKAISLGRTRNEDIRKYVRLLATAGRIKDAKLQLEKMDRATWTKLDELQHLQIQAQLGELPEDIEYDRESTNAIYHLTIGNILANDARQRVRSLNGELDPAVVKRMTDAEARFRTAVELEPALESGWRSLIQILVLQGRRNEAEQAMREAELEVSEERTQLFLAHASETIGKYGEAYRHYQNHLSTNPGNFEALRSLAALLLRGDAARQREAMTYLDMICKAPSTGAIDEYATVSWARRVQAEMLAATNTYHDFVEALSLIESNKIEGQPMSAEDLLLFARLSASRNDGVSRDRAIEKLEEVRQGKQRRLTRDELLVLAELYKKQDRWQDCSNVMNNLLSKYPNDMALLSPWLAWLVENNQLKLAERWLENAQENSLAAVRTRAHIWVRRGQSERAVSMLTRILPREIKTKEQAQLVLTVATYMEQMAKDDPSLHDVVEKIWRFYTQELPGESLRLARYLGHRGSDAQIDEAFQICQVHVDANRVINTIPVGVGILRVNQSRIAPGSKYHRLVQSWFDLAEKSDPGSPALLIQRSEFEGLVGDYDAFERLLRDYIATDNTTPHQKATAYNNLAYVLALRGQGEESMGLVKEAIDILGPISDLRDTRAMVYLALDEPRKAIDDLDAAIAHGGETPFKFFHKALAELHAGNRVYATEAFERALELGLEVDQLNALEQEQFNTLVEKLGIEIDKPVSIN